MEEERKSLAQLFVPICLETLCFMLAGMVDTLMLSSVSDEAVGAVGTANTYISMFIMMFGIISSGMIAVMTQYIGANKPGIAYQARQLGAVFNAVMGLVISAFLFFFSGNVLEFVGIAEGLKVYATEYLQIVGSCCFLNALIPIFSYYLRAFGFTKQALISTFTGNVVNLILNSIFLFALGMGVKGVAIATVISKVVNLIMVIWFSHRLVHAKEDEHRMENGKVLAKIIKIGLPSALETGLYYVALTLVVRFLNQMDSSGLHVTARSYAAQITNFAFVVGAGLAQANAIMTGWRIGAKEYDQCDKETKRAAAIGVVISAGTEAIFALSANVLIRLFTDDPVMVDLVRTLLFIDIVLEVGRVSNLVYGNALKTSGDAVFPSVLAAIFMYLCAVGGTWLFGIHFGMGAVGAYIGLAADECVRALGMFLRWKTGIWREKGLTQEEELKPEATQ
ncbi:MAG: MATE family efflux transporter [Agathobacter sp.]|nr:MATE family efflux transporter [Agathobacter sp.]